MRKLQSGGARIVAAGLEPVLIPVLFLALFAPSARAAKVFGFYEDFERYTVGQPVPADPSDPNTWDEEGGFHEAERTVSSERSHWGTKSFKITYHREEDAWSLIYNFYQHAALADYPTSFQATWWEYYTGHWNKDIRCLKTIAINGLYRPAEPNFSFVTSCWPAFGGGMPRVMMNPFWTRLYGGPAGDWVFTRVPPDTWTKFHFVTRLNTPGAYDGYTRYEVNDIVLLNLTGTAMRPPDSNHGFRLFWNGGNISQACSDTYPMPETGTDGQPCRLDPPLVRYIDDFWWTTDLSQVPSWETNPPPDLEAPRADIKVTE